MLLKSAILSLAAAPLVAAVVPLDIRGNAFVNPNTGKKFQIIGMAYQIGGESQYKPEQGIDPLSDPEVCRRDAALMQRLGINAIRSYNLSPDINHDECASIFNAAGIYMLLDVNAPGFGNSLHREEPWTTYFDGYLNRTFGIVEAFKNYPNTLAFFAANEVIDKPGTGAVVPPYLRAMQRDLRNYIAANSDRHIPVGYSAADVRPVLADTYNYLTCINDPQDNSHAEFFALNSYSWCGPDATFKSSTFAELTDMFKNSPVPVFLSEYGCNEPQPRYFNEIQSIYGPDMLDTFSGGIVYEWSMEANNYGVVTINDDKSVELLADYDVLNQQYAKLDVSALQNGEPSGSPTTPPTCNPRMITEDNFNNNFTIPLLPPGGQELVDNGIDSAPVGRIVPISDYAFPFSVTDTAGKQVTGLEVRPLADDESNMPNGEGAGGGDGNSAAGFVRPVVALAAGVPGLLALFALA